MKSNKKVISQQNAQELPIDEGYSKNFLRIVIAICVFLFTVTLSGVMGINLMFVNSKNQVVSNFTIQVLPANSLEENRKELLDVVSFLENYPDVNQVSVLSDDELTSLLEPWLGGNVDLEILPIPQLLDVKINNYKNFDYKELTVRLSEVSSNATVNDHNLWLSRLLKFINSLKMLALSILIMVAVICVFAITYAATTGLNVHRETISILHIMGAKDEYIALNYVKQISLVSIASGVVGTILSVPAIMFIGNIAKDIQAGIFNSITFGVDQWFIIILLPLVAALLVAITAYITVFKKLRSLV